MNWPKWQFFRTFEFRRYVGDSERNEDYRRFSNSAVVRLSKTFQTRPIEACTEEIAGESVQRLYRTRANFVFRLTKKRVASFRLFFFFITFPTPPLPFGV